MSSIVAPGQRWNHLPSGDLRIVLDVVRYEVAAGVVELPSFQREFGITHVARMVTESGARDRRDSSDMEIVGPPFRPFRAASWRLLGAAP